MTIRKQYKIQYRLARILAKIHREIEPKLKKMQAASDALDSVGTDAAHKYRHLIN